jgi:hypothetical protein
MESSHSHCWLIAWRQKREAAKSQIIGSLEGVDDARRIHDFEADSRKREEEADTSKALTSSATTEWNWRRQARR